MGRPRKYDSPEQMQRAIDEYFKEVHAEHRPPSICGLTLHLGFNDRHALLNYEGYEEEFYAIIKKAKTQIEMYHEEQLSSKGKQQAGHIFWLKANAQWTETSVQVHDVTGTLATLLGKINGSNQKPPSETGD